MTEGQEARWHIGQRVQVDCLHGTVLTGTIARELRGDYRVDLDGGGHLWQGTRSMKPLDPNIPGTQSG